MFSKIQALFIFVTLFSMVQAADPSIGNSNIREVTITIKDARFKRPLFNSPYNQVGLVHAVDAKANDQKDEFRPVIENLERYNVAKYEDQLYVTNLQVHHKDLPQHPILLLTSGKSTSFMTNGSVGCQPIPFDREKFMVLVMPLELYEGDAKRYFIHHELGHVRNLKKFNNEFYNHPWGYKLHKTLEIWTYFCGAGFSILLLNSQFAPLNEAAKMSFNLMTFLPYLTARSMGHIKSRDSCAVELSCDRYALELANTHEEKKAICVGHALHFFGSSEIGIKDIACFLLISIPFFSSSHPSPLYRIYKMYSYLRKN